MRLRVLLVTTIALAGALVAAALTTAPPRPPAPAGGQTLSAADALVATLDPAEPGSPPAGAGSTGSGGPVAPADGAQENQMAFAYAATDVTALDAQLQEIGAAVTHLGGAADSLSLGSMKDSAREVQALAGAMRDYAAAAHARLAPLTPSDPTLGAVWRDALAAYTQLRTHAEAALELADFALTLDPAKAASASRSIISLGGGGTDLITQLAAVRDTLDGWSQHNGTTARSALSAFGTPAR